MRYFDHDTMAGGDKKIVVLRHECGGAAVDAYWVILECIYQDETALDYFGNRNEKLALCIRLSVSEEKLDEWVLKMLELGLFVYDEDNPQAITSERAKENIKAYQEKCETARQNGRKGGRKPNANQAGSNQQTERQAKKRKEKKDIGSHKENQISSAVAAVAVSTAPPAEGVKPHCPMCNELLFRNTQTGKATCPCCGDTFERDKAVWR